MKPVHTLKHKALKNICAFSLQIFRLTFLPLHLSPSHIPIIMHQDLPTVFYHKFLYSNLCVLYFFHISVVLGHGWTNFPKIWEPPQIFGCHKGGMKYVPQWRPTNIRRRSIKFSRPGELAMGIWATLIIQQVVSSGKACDWYWHMRAADLGGNTLLSRHDLSSFPQSL